MTPSEPNLQPLRPIGMKTISIAGVVLALGVMVAGCGDSPDDHAPGQDDLRVTVGDCNSADDAIEGAKDIAILDLDGDGTDESLRLATEAPCAGTLFAIAGEQVWSAEVDTAAFEEPARVITRTGEKAELLLVSKSHPRGGFQATLYAAAGGELGEVRAGDEPLFDFVATDVERPGMSARCGKAGSLVLTTAAPTQPPGVLMAYDVFEQSFAIDGLTATPGKRTRIAHSVPDSQMQKRYPQLMDNTLFAGCSS